jgi:hypothetical protein
LVPILQNQHWQPAPIHTWPGFSCINRILSAAGAVQFFLGCTAPIPILHPPRRLNSKLSF